ncbi:hypothetical protein C4K04_3658 [Pseudomonas chlororaphis]|uniref:Uncharacterized protein n=1 Tax=Pseudomonas chlororaphis TaxID=587753 RepID=A0A3G7TSC4_9PSED|nr:hypothetical protein C4K04_3658 [Pseudomonas chlororaphis]
MRLSDGHERDSLITRLSPLEKPCRFKPPQCVIPVSKKIRG